MQGARTTSLTLCSVSVCLLLFSFDPYIASILPDAPLALTEDAFVLSKNKQQIVIVQLSPAAWHAPKCTFGQSARYVPWEWLKD
jgi:hypothetical protein